LAYIPRTEIVRAWETVILVKLKDVLNNMEVAFFEGAGVLHQIHGLHLDWGEKPKDDAAEEACLFT
jgi:hypothetical protein